MGSGTDVLVAMFRSFGAGVLPANFLQGAVSDPVDKVVTYLIIWAILQALPIRFKGRFSNLGPSQG
jgi:energy-coupling factor transport system substrate-specific component